jgi:hypothetical protein
MLQSILAVTICAEDLPAVEAAYTKYLNYRVTERGAVSSVLAKHWRAPLMAGRPYLLLQSESGAKVYLRFVQATPVAGYEPLKTYGWNATEILVQDPDALAERLADSPFKIIGPPRNLSSDENIRAMQVLGPAQELLYLTRVKPDGSVFKLGSAATEVDHAFIVVCGHPTLAAARDFYASQLHLKVTPPSGVRMSVLSKAHGLDPEVLHPLALVELRETGLIELDQSPTQTKQRPQHEGELPPGLALVSFAVDALEGFAATVLPEALYDGRRAVILRGAAGEWIELIES